MDVFPAALLGLQMSMCRDRDLGRLEAVPRSARSWVREMHRPKAQLQRDNGSSCAGVKRFSQLVTQDALGQQWCSFIARATIRRVQ